MPLNHPTQLCQAKFTIKDEELRISITVQCAKKVVSDSPGLVTFGIRLVCILFVTCPMGKWCFLRNSNNRRTVKSILLVRKLLGLVNASFSSPKWQAVKMIFFAPCPISHCFSQLWVQNLKIFTFSRLASLLLTWSSPVVYYFPVLEVHLLLFSQLILHQSFESSASRAPRL